MTGWKGDEDAFGHIIYDNHKGLETDHVIERDDGYVDPMIGDHGYLSEYKDWPPHEMKAMKLVKGRVLDIGCGAGRHSIYLQNKGLDVLGVDNSRLALKACKERGLKKTKHMDITQISSKLGKFDTILMLGNNFGLFSSVKQARWLLRRFRNMTSPDARIIAASMEVYATEKPEHLWYHKRNRKLGRLGGQVRIRARYKKYKTPWFDYLIVSKEEMEMILEGTGWKVRQYLDNEHQYIAIIEKA